MPLSEYEQRMLQQMEQQLRSDDPKLANTLADKPRPSARRVGLGVVAFVLGLIALVGGVATELVVIGVLGFVAMLGGVLLAMASGPKREDGPDDGGGGPAPRPGGAKPSGGFMQRQEERWQRRNDGR